MTIGDINRSLPEMVKVDNDVYENLSLFLDELLVWNKKINLTAIRDKQLCWEKHVVDSLLLAEFIDKEKGLLDVGSGAGFPSIPLSLLLRDLTITSVDTVGKKIQFQKHCIRKFKLNTFTAIATRIENLPGEYKKSFQQITSRAFASLELFCRLTVPFLAKGGIAIAMKGPDYQREIDDAGECLQHLGLVVRNVHVRQLKPSCETRAFVIIGYQS